MQQQIRIQYYRQNKFMYLQQNCNNFRLVQARLPVVFLKH